MLDQVILYLGVHPAVLTAMGLTATLAGVGLWYVVHHHLQAILITLLTAAGIGSGMLVLYRGFRTDMKDLMGIGLFLIAIFPVIFWQAIKQLEPAEPAVRTGRPRAPSTGARRRNPAEHFAPHLSQRERSARRAQHDSRVRGVRSIEVVTPHPLPYAAFLAFTAMATSSAMTARTPFKRSVGRSQSPLNTSR